MYFCFYDGIWMDAPRPDGIYDVRKAVGNRWVRQTKDRAK